MDKKFIKEYYSKNKFEKYFHRQFTQTYESRRKTLLTPDFKRKNNSKKYNGKLYNDDRITKFNIKYITIKYEYKNNIILSNNNDAINIFLKSI